MIESYNAFRISTGRNEGTFIMRIIRCNGMLDIIMRAWLLTLYQYFEAFDYSQWH